MPLLRAGRYRFSSTRPVEATCTTSATRWSLACRVGMEEREPRGARRAAAECSHHHSAGFSLEVFRLNVTGPHNEGRLDVTVRAIDLLPIAE